MTAWVRGTWVLTLLLLVVAAHQGRRAFIHEFFVDGEPGGPAPALSRPVDPVNTLSPAARVRVVLIDGLSAMHADRLPTLNQKCAGGLDVRVDSGFPTVSLPVQHVLWTGRTQQQSGVLYRIAQLQEAPPDALPSQIPDSVGVAESHPEIVRSFGFGESWPPPSKSEAEARQEFDAAATAAVAGPGRLVFVHILRVDEAGHANGSGSSAYEAAATWSDRLLARLTDADAAAHAGSVWVVLSDHGHRPSGGHAGSETDIRVVRACLWGPGVEAATLPEGRELHLVDLSRALFELSARAPSTSAAGRPLRHALEHPDRAATLPVPGPIRVVGAAAVLLVAAGVLVWLRLGPWSWPWWLLVTYVGVLAAHGVPTLSVPAIYSPLGRDLALAAGPGWLVLIGQLYRGRGAGPRVVAALLSTPALILVALGILVVETPPLTPRWTAEVSLWMVVLQGCAIAAAVALAVLWGDKDRA